MNTATKERHRPLRQIAREIAQDWGNKMSPHAKPYVNAMMSLDQITDKFYADDAQDIVLRFGVNAAQWRGPKAREIKAELKAILKGNGYTY